MKKLLSSLKIGVLILSAGMMTACSSGGGGGGSTGPQTVLVIGDSISGKTNYPGVPPWPTLLADMMPEWTVINRATAGERMAGGTAKVGGLLAEYNPDSLVIFYGSNNAIRSDVDTFESDLAAAIQAGLDAGCQRVLVCMPPYMYGDRAIFNGNIDLVNQGVRNAAGSLGAAISNINGEFGMSSEHLFPDGLHPNLDGQRIIAVNVRERL